MRAEVTKLPFWNDLSNDEQEINSAREVVARALSKLAGNGVVSMQRGKVIIKDIKQLELMI